MSRLIILSCLSFVLGCQTISSDIDQTLERPVNCKYAREQLARLEAERVSVGQQISAGVRNVIPTAAVRGILTGDTKIRRKVATGAYNREIDAKIDQIHHECGVRPEELSAEGLVEVRSARVDVVEAKPGTNLAQYKSLLILPVFFHFQEGRSERTPEDSALEAVRRDFHAVFERELTRGGYQVVDHPGAEVLLVRAGLVDIVLTGSSEPTSARDRSYASEVGKATLVAEFRDSTSGDLLARAADRRSIGGSGSHRTTRARNRSEAREEFRRWAKLLRKRMDEIQELAETRSDD